MFLSADFWPLFGAVIGGGAVLTGLLSAFVANLGQAHHRPVPQRTEAVQRHQDEAAAPARAA